MKTAILLTEATATTGLGHLTRCQALFGALSQEGFRAELWLQSDAGVERAVQAEGIRHLPWRQDPQLIQQALDTADVLVIDSYLASDSLLERIAQEARLPVFLDDTLRMEYQRGIVINGALGAERLPYPYSASVRHLLGNRYTLFRQPFIEVSPYSVRETVERVLLTFGAVDPMQLLPLAIETTRRAFPGAEVVMVAGEGLLHKQAVEAAAAKAGKVRFALGLSAAQMQQLFQEVDLAVSAAGQTLQELVRCGVPVVAAAVADNQRFLLQGLQIREAVHTVSAENLQQELEQAFEMLAPKQARAKLNLATQGCYDGLGAARIATFLREASGEVGEASRTTAVLVARPATRQDVDLYFRWANDPLVRANSYHSDPIAYDGHVQWFMRKVQAALTRMYVLEAHGIPAGQVRFEPVSEADQSFVIGISVDEAFRGKGLASDMLQRACQTLEGEKGRVPIHAYIKLENVSSLKSFQKAGFHLQGQVIEQGWPSYFLIRNV